MPKQKQKCNMKDKDLVSLYEKILLKEQEELNPINVEHPQNSDEEEFDILNQEDDVVDPLDERDDDAPKEALKELVSAVDNLLQRHQNVIDGAKTEKSFMKEIQDLLPIIRSLLNKISI